MLRCSIIVRVADHPRLWPSLPSELEPATRRPFRTNRVRHSTHKSLIKSLFHFTAIRSHNQRPKFLESEILVSRPRPPAISERSEAKLWWHAATSHRRSRSRAARRSPHCCWPGRLSWKRVVGWLGNGLCTQQRPHTQRRRIDGVGSGRRDTPAARAYHALRSHCTHLHPRMCSLQTRGGEAQCRLLSQGRILYTMMMSAAVLARGLIGIC